MKSRQSFYGRFSEAIVTTSSGLIFVLLFIPQAAYGQVVISEVMYDVAGSDSKAEWIELQNTGASAIDISKWKINDGSNHVFNMPPKNGSVGSLVMQPNSFLILAADAATFFSLHSGMSVSIIDTVLNLSNTGGTISLLDARSTAIDKVTYASSQGANGTGESLQKINGAFVTALPTPGTTNATVRKPQPVIETVPASHPATVKKTKISPTKTSKPAAESMAPVGDPVASSTPVIPIVDTSSPLSSWIFGALAVGVAGSAAVLVARKKKAGEWDIEEIEEDV